MDKNELKKALKPIIKETLKEVLLEEGILSKVISEVVKGLNSNIIVEQPQPRQNTNKNPHTSFNEYRQSLNETKKDLKEQKNKLAEATGLNSKLFDTIGPEVSAPILRESKQTKTTVESENMALRNVSPDDPGININGILNVIGGKKTWKTFMQPKKGNQ